MPHGAANPNARDIGNYFAVNLNNPPRNGVLTEYGPYQYKYQVSNTRLGDKAVIAAGRKQAAANVADRKATATAAAVAASFANPTYKFNPPAIRSANGAPKYAGPKSTSYSSGVPTSSISSLTTIAESTLFSTNFSPVHDYTGQHTGRELVMLDSDQRARVLQKGFVVPDTSFAKQDWQITGNDGAQTNATDPYAQMAIDPTNVYGFRFQYNPTTLDFTFGVGGQGMNVSLMYSSGVSAMPSGIGADGAASISIGMILSRVEDMAAINIDVKNNAKVDDAVKYYGYEISNEELLGIKTRGTMFDIEYLMRALTGRPHNTVYRGLTADTGILFSVPLRLFLGGLPAGNTPQSYGQTSGGGLTYRVRASGLSFTHKIFTPDMIPTYTELSMSFDRIPDAIPDGIGSEHDIKSPPGVSYLGSTTTSWANGSTNLYTLGTGGR